MASVVSSDIYASLSQTQINASVSQPPSVLVSLSQTPISVAVSSNGGGNNHDPVTLGIANGLSLSGQVLSLSLSATGTVGALSAIDYNTFNSKLSDAPSNGLTYGRNNGAWVNITGTGGSSLPVADTTAIVMGSSDPTKLLRFEVDGFSAGATRILTPPNQNATIAGLEVSQTFTVNQVIDAHAAIGNNATVDLYGSIALTIAEEATGASSTDPLAIRGQYVDLEARPSADASQTSYRAAEYWSYSVAGDNQPINVLNAFVGGVSHENAGDLAVSNGVEAYIFGYGGDIDVSTGLYSYSEFGGGTIGNAFAASYELWVYGGTVTNATGQRILLTNAGGTVTNAIGLDISDINFATTINMSIRTNRGDVRLMSSALDKLGFHGSTPVAKQTVTGSRGGNDALADLLTKLANLGLITNSTTA